LTIKFRLKTGYIHFKDYLSFLLLFDKQNKTCSLSLMSVSCGLSVLLPVASEIIEVIIYLFMLPMKL